jgi:hypothetical protein
MTNTGKKDMDNTVLGDPLGALKDGFFLTMTIKIKASPRRP